MIGNINKDKFNLACCWCGTQTELNQVAHRNTSGLVIGYLFLCNDCLPAVAGNYRLVIEKAKKTKE